MNRIKEKNEEILEKIDSLYERCSNIDWKTLKRENFASKLEDVVTRTKILYEEFYRLNKELSTLIEKDVPDLTKFINEFEKNLEVLKANLKMELNKTFTHELINEFDTYEVPELYESMSERILKILLLARKENHKVNSFITKKNKPATQNASAKELLGLLEKKDDEIQTLKERNLELNRITFLGLKREKDSTDIEKELTLIARKISIDSTESKLLSKECETNSKRAMENATTLRTKIIELEKENTEFFSKTIELVKTLKKERDLARRYSLETEHDSQKIKNTYTRELFELKNEKAQIKFSVTKNYQNQIKDFEKQIRKKNKLIEEMENHLRKKKNSQGLNEIYKEIKHDKEMQNIL